MKKSYLNYECRLHKMITSERTSEEIKESDIVRITWMLDTHIV